MLWVWETFLVLAIFDFADSEAPNDAADLFND